MVLNKRGFRKIRNFRQLSCCIGNGKRWTYGCHGTIIGSHRYPIDPVRSDDLEWPWKVVTWEAQYFFDGSAYVLSYHLIKFSLVPHVWVCSCCKGSGMPSSQRRAPTRPILTIQLEHGDGDNVALPGLTSDWRGMPPPHRFDVERPNSVSLTRGERRGFRGSATPPIPRGGPRRSPFWGSPTYAYTLWCTATKFGAVTYLRREGYILVVSRAIAYCTNALHGLSTIAEFLVSRPWWLPRSCSSPRCCW